jgi:hypothetical protein
LRIYGQREISEKNFLGSEEGLQKIEFVELSSHRKSNKITRIVLQKKNYFILFLMTTSFYQIKSKKEFATQPYLTK